MMARTENAGKPWIAGEDNQLRQLVVSGAPTNQIAERLDRTEASVRARAYFLGLILRRFGPRRRGMSRWG
jgi:FixJ family two-component response regulator